MDKYQELIKEVKEYIEKTEAIKGRELTNEDFICEESPCKSKPEITYKDGNKFWTIDGLTIIDRSNEKLISNETTFIELLGILAKNPDVVANAQAEAEEKAEEEKDATLREKLGEDYDLVFDKKKAYNGRRQCLGANDLRATIPHISVIEMGNDGICEVFNNGYAVYDNGNRKTVLWVPDCGTATYYFAPLTDKEKLYLKQMDEVDMGVLGKCPWYHALMIAGENRIEYNMLKHPKSKGTSSDSDLDDAKPADRWAGGSHFDNPETAFLKKEAAEERRKVLTEKQQVICELHFEDGMSLRNTANEIGIDYTTVREQANSIKNRLKKDPERFISTF